MFPCILFLNQGELGTKTGDRVIKILLLTIVVFCITLPVADYSAGAMRSDIIVDNHAVNSLDGMDRSDWKDELRLTLNPTASAFNQETSSKPLQYAQAPGRVVSIQGRVLRKSNGKGLVDAAVRLLDPDGVLMDATKTDTKGFFTIDLSVLEDDELAQINLFIVEVTNKQGVTLQIKIKDKGKRASNILKLSDITVP